MAIQYEANLSLSEARNTPYVDGYNIVGVMDDGALMCNTCLNLPEVHERDESDGWRYEGSMIYWEGPMVMCAHCGNDMESEYGDPVAGR